MKAGPYRPPALPSNCAGTDVNAIPFSGEIVGHLGDQNAIMRSTVVWRLDVSEEAATRLRRRSNPAGPILALQALAVAAPAALSPSLIVCYRLACLGGLAKGSTSAAVTASL